jgi:hypothetical protein
MANHICSSKDASPSAGNLSPNAKMLDSDTFFGNPHTSVILFLTSMHLRAQCLLVTPTQAHNSQYWEGSNGWIAALWFKRREVKNADTFCVLLGFTPNFGASVRIVLPRQNKNHEDLFRIFNPRAPSVLESFLSHESKSQSGRLYTIKEKLYIDLGLDQKSGEEIYVVHIVMES